MPQRVGLCFGSNHVSVGGLKRRVAIAATDSNRCIVSMLIVCTCGAGTSDKLVSSSIAKMAAEPETFAFQAGKDITLFLRSSSATYFAPHRMAFKATLLHLCMHEQ